MNSYLYQYQVDKVTMGTRKSLVGWIQGLAFR